MKSLYRLLFFITAIHLQAQTTTQNYIVTTVPNAAVSNPTSIVDNGSSSANANTTIQYFDGLGRPSQSVQKAITPAGADLVSGIVYDDYGREKQKWLPGAVSGNNGAYVSDFGTASISTNGNDSSYATTEYEASPLNRVTGQYGAGADWYVAGKKKSIEYTTNGSDVKLFTVDNDQLKCSGTYGAATLYGQKTTDEDGKTVEEFTDKQGRKILSRVAGTYDTYYVYDDLDNLRYVLPPSACNALGDGTYANTTDVLAQYAYLYTYDGRKRCITKRLPGCDWIYMVYDQTDRLILSQDGNQRLKNQWTVNKYDIFGRLLYSGLLYDTSSRATMESSYSGSVVTESYTGGGSCGGYSSLQLTPSRLLTVNYYDSYAFLSYSNNNPDGMLTSTAPDGYTAPDKDHIKTLLTGTRIYLLDDSARFEVTALYYDKYGHIVQSRATNHLGGYNVVCNLIDFVGKPRQTYKTHSVNSTTPSITELYTYTYDQAGRLIETRHSLNGGTSTSLVQNSYDDLGRVTSKNVGGVDTTAYTYNVRGWISSISGSRFAENLYYTNGPSGLGVTACYNGNIAGMQWGVPSESLGYNRAYRFIYDDLNRLTKGVYCGLNSGSLVTGIADKYNEAMSYDEMGNILTLNRTEDGSALNNLSMNYTGNQLKAVTDGSSVTKRYGSEAFDDGPQALTVEYAYNKNGSTTYDANSGISTIRYNVLNLPDTIQFSEGHKNFYTYDAAGKKLRLRNTTSVRILNVPQDSIVYYTKVGEAYKTTLTDYVDNYIYQNDTLKMVLLPEGYWQNGKYYYYLKDHLGDNRVTINSSGTVMEKSHYYPSGMRFYPESSSDSTALPYRYNGKELEAMNGLNQYDYGARRREAGLPIWTALDPLAEKKPWMSPYAYCSDNPMNRIDPDGKDDYFKRDGTFDHHTDTKVNRILIVDGKKTKSLTSYNYSSKNSANRAMLSNVGTFYASKAGINQQIGIKDVNTSVVGSGLASTNPTTLNVSFSANQKTGQINKEAGIADNLVNSFVHEKSHIDSPSLMGTPQGEIKAIETQVLDPSFANTTKSFKSAALNYASQNLNLEIQGSTSTNVQGDIFNLNSIFTGVGRLNLNSSFPSIFVDFELDQDEVTVTAPRIK
jgi:RHS repeat-associated protein